MITISMLVILIATPMNLLLSYTIDLVLMAPTVQEANSETSPTAIRRASAIQSMSPTLTAVSADTTTSSSRKPNTLIASSLTLNRLKEREMQKKRKTSKVFTMSLVMNDELQQMAISTHKAMRTQTEIMARGRSLSVSRTGVSVLKTIMTLMSQVEQHRSHLHKRDRAHFDAQWHAVCAKESRATRALEKEVETVSKEADAWVKKLKKMPTAHAGVKILELFVRDLIGRDSLEAAVFSVHIDPFLDTLVVTWSLKCLAVTCLILANLYFIFSCMLYGLEKGLSWQRGWLIASLINIAVDIFVKQVNIAVIVYYYIPDLIFETTTTVKLTMKKVVDEMCKQQSQYDNNIRSTFSATDYLFVSTQVAREFPDLVESVLVSSYRSQTVSTKQSIKWTNQPIDSKPSNLSQIMDSGLFVWMTDSWETFKLRTNIFILRFGTLPMFYQASIISGLNPVLVGIVAYIGVAVFNNSVMGIPLGFGIVLLGIGASMIFTHKKDFGVWSSNRVANINDSSNHHGDSTKVAPVDILPVKPSSGDVEMAERVVVSVVADKDMFGDRADEPEYEPGDVSSDFWEFDDDDNDSMSDRSEGAFIGGNRSSSSGSSSSKIGVVVPVVAITAIATQKMDHQSENSFSWDSYDSVEGEHDEKGEDGEHEGEYTNTGNNMARLNLPSLWDTSSEEGDDGCSV